MKGKELLPFKFVSRFIFENLANTGRTRKQFLSFFIDGAIVAFAVWAAFSLRLGEFYYLFENISLILLFLPPLTVLMFAGLGIYRWVVRSSSSRQIEQLLKGSIASSLVLLILFHLFSVTFAPRSVFIIYGLVLIILVVSYRVIWARMHNGGLEGKGKPIVIYGAGASGRQIVSLMKLSCEFRPIFFIDDSVALIGSTVSGLNVFDPSDPLIKNKFKNDEIVEIILAMQSISTGRYKEILQLLGFINIPIKTIPPITDILSGKRSLNEIKNMDLEDLLGRDTVEPDHRLLKKCIEGKVVLVTGAGGSIGSELCRQIVVLGAKSIVLLDHSEFSLYKIHQELLELKSHRGLGVIINTALASITDRSRINDVFREHLPTTVYHAAAYKHVPMIEAHPFEGVKTNIFGTNNVVLSAEKYHVNTFVFISTDKAVRPTNIMGATKRIAEQILQARAIKSGQTTTYCMVRFGNVLGSSGSVIPLFMEQILKGGPVTVTHPEMTRYFMTIPEAVSLVIQAGSMSCGGEVFLLDMGPQVKILDMAKTMIRLHGLNALVEGQRKKDSDHLSNEIEIIYTGIRPGEKLYEELLINQKSSKKTNHKKINMEQDDDYSYEHVRESCLKPLQKAVNDRNIYRIKTIISENVTGYKELAE